MAPLGLGMLWIGYTLAYFGFCSVRGPGVGLFDLIVPGRAVVIPTSAGGPTFSTPGATIKGADGEDFHTGSRGTVIRPVPGRDGQSSFEPAIPDNLA